MKLGNTLILFGALGLFFVGLSALYADSKYWMTEGKTPEEAIWLAIGYWYWIFMGMFVLLGWYRLRKRRNQDSQPNSTKSKK